LRRDEIHFEDHYYFELGDFREQRSSIRIAGRHWRESWLELMRNAF